MKICDNIEIRFHGDKVGELSLSPDNKCCVFEYSSRWLVEGFSISPLELPLKQGVFVAKPTPFAGNFGIFEDSLPDGYGRYLLHKSLMKGGIDDTNLTSLDRLSIVGENGMGALTYHPTNDIFIRDTKRDLDYLQGVALEVLREYSDENAQMLLYNSGNSGGARPKVIYSDCNGHWLVKFRHTYDPVNVGQDEYKYNEIARDCGITVPDFKLMNGKYFASRRFDLTNEGERIHVATVGGLLGISLATPVLDYSNLLALTGWLTRSQIEVEEMYRRMVFNYMVGNKDDHCKNFSFYVLRENNQWKWHLAPAYDLTLCQEGYNGQHATSVLNNCMPTVKDFIAVGSKIKLPISRCKAIIDEVVSGTKEINCYDLKP